MHNEMATLLMQPHEAAIKQVRTALRPLPPSLHSYTQAQPLPTSLPTFLQLFSRSTAGYFSPSSLALFVLCYYCATVLIYGV